ncbi:MAG: PAS domain S-box protein, partial [Candidatus Thorarchaeota archaeon]
MDDRSRPVVPHSGEIPYQAIVDTMNDALVIVDENQVIKYANHSFMELIGYRLEDIIGRHVKDFLDEDNWHKVQEHLKKRREGYSTQYELEWIHWTGDRVQTIVSATPIFEKGEYRGSFGVITDITALRLEQEKRLRTERRFRAILEAMNEAVAFVDGKLRVQYGNNRLFEMLGYTPEEVLGESALKYVDTTERETIQSFVLRPEEEAGKTYELVLISKSGERVHTLVTPKPIYDDEGRLIGIIGVLLDVSELKHVYSLMRETEARYESLFKEMPVGLISVRADGKVLNANERAAEILGAPSAEALFEIDFLHSPGSRASGIPEAVQK